MQSRNIIIGVLGGLLILVVILAIFWNRPGSEESADLKQLEATVAELRTNLQEKEEAIQELNEELQKRGQLPADASLQDQIKALEAEVERRKQIQEALNQKAKEEIDEGKIEIAQGFKKTVLRLEDQILFATGEANLKPEGLALLQKVVELLQSVKDHEIQVEGHTDSRPIGEPRRRIYATNWELSAARSLTVVRHLVEKLGVDAARISAAGFGQFRPVANNDTPDNMQKNRRVEFVLRPLDLE